MTRVCVQLWCEQSLCETAVWALSLSTFSMFQHISALALRVVSDPCCVPSDGQLPGVTLVGATFGYEYWCPASLVSITSLSLEFFLLCLVVSTDDIQKGRYFMASLRSYRYHLYCFYYCQFNISEWTVMNIIVSLAISSYVLQTEQDIIIKVDPNYYDIQRNIMQDLNTWPL